MRTNRNSHFYELGIGKRLMGLYGSIFGLCVNIYIQYQRQRQHKRTKIEREQLFGFGEQM